jgi:hypothetical protein
MANQTKTGEEMKTITIIGRRWFQRGPGNTYHTAQIIVDGETIKKTDREYGYGEQYVETAVSWLENNDWLPEKREHYKNGGHEAAWRFCERLGIKLSTEAIDVARQRDL